MVHAVPSLINFTATPPNRLPNRVLPVREESRYAAPPNSLPNRVLPVREEPRYAAPPEEYNQYGPNTDIVAVDKAIKEIDYQLSKFKEDPGFGPWRYIGDNEREREQFNKLTYKGKRGLVYDLQARKELLKEYINKPTEYELKRNNSYRINVLGNSQFNGRLYPKRIEKLYAEPPAYFGGVRRTKHRSRKSRTKKASRKYRSRNTRSK